LASLYSYEVITTCSPRNFDLVKELGANFTFDYSSPDVVEQIKSAAPDLAYVFDTIGNSSSSETASRAAKAPAHICTVRPGKANTGNVVEGIEVTDVLVWTAFLKDHSYGKYHWPVSTTMGNRDCRVR
jgi:NADPH:quinone reductase-like Zn-dependent oxidoreductase